MPSAAKSIFSARRLLAVYVAAGTLFFGCVLAGVIALNIASLEANRFAMSTERKLVNSELTYFIERAIREQGELSYWDESKKNLVMSNPPNERFVTEYISSWLVSELGFSDVVLVEPNGLVKLSVQGSSIEFGDQKSELLDLGRDLVGIAREIYDQKRKKVGDKYLVEADSGQIVPQIQAYAYRLWDGVPTLVVAQVMIAERLDFASRDQEEVVFLAAKQLTSEIIAQTAERLALNAVKVTPASEVAQGESEASVAMPDMGGQASLVVTWEPRSPREVILWATLPLSATMMLVLMVVLFFIVHRHASTLKKLTVSEATNRFLATHDSLTGLPNRKKFEDELEGAFSLSAMHCFAVMYIDLDRFKEVNDRHGHAAGDEVLLQVARRLETAIGGKGTVARIGGDEFVALIVADLNSDELHWFATELIEEVSRPIAFGEIVLGIGASIGIAIAPHNGSNPRTIMHSADAALYSSKKNGRGRAVVWENAA